MDSTKSILNSTKRFFGGTILSRISGMLRDISMAYAFGTQETVAAFLVAFRLAHLLRRLFGEGAMQSAFIPQFETLRKDSPERACSFFRDLICVVSMGLTALILVSMLILGGCLQFLDLSEGNREILYFTSLLMPSLLFICLFGIHASLLQCEKNYFITGVAPVAFNLMWVIGVLFLQQMPHMNAMSNLCIWVIVACMSQWLITVPGTWRILKRYGLQKPWQHFRLLTADIRGLFLPLLLGILGVAATQVNNALDAIFARFASLEGPAMLWYALRLQQLPLALFGVALAGALLPPLTRAIKSGDLIAYQNFLTFALRRSIALMLPLTAMIFVMGDSSVNLIFGRGDFTDRSIVGTTQCLWAYGAGLVPMTLVLLLAPAYYAQSNQRTPAIASLITVLANVVLNTLMIVVWELGPASVAIATSLSACVNVALLAKGLVQLKAIVSRAFIGSFVKILLSALVASLAVIVADVYLLNGSSVLQIIQGGIPVFSREFTNQLWRLGLQGVCFIFGLGLSAWLLQADDLLSLSGRKFIRAKT